jgi:uncharacterized OB-fold protein
MVAPTYAKPLPIPNPASEPFWHAARRHELSLQRCESCGAWVFYPRAACPECLSPRLSWKRASGRATLYSFTVARRPTAPQFADVTPLVIAVVALEEGPRMMSNVVGCAPEDVRIGMALEAAFDDVTADTTLVKFKPAGDP